MLNIIVAVDENMGIGKDNKLLAHISPDLKYFKRMTEGKTVVMGYNTYMSLPVRPLKNRKNIIITSKNIEIQGAIVMNSIEEVLKYSQSNINEEIFIIGGASIYKQFLNHADKLYITHIFDKFEADTFFPSIEDWKLKSAFGTHENLNHKHKHMFAMYQKK